jgi:DNA primase small subunit
MNTIKIHDDFLVDDFDIDSKYIQINYSGHRGYHIRVSDPKLFKLESQSRIEIIHYITGMGLDSEKLIRTIGTSNIIPARTIPGWGGKIADAILEYLRDIEEQSDEPQWMKHLKKHKTAAAEGLIRNPPILNPRVSGVGLKSWQEIAKDAALVYGGKTDIPVTHDIHRVIRLIGSVNGKTGFDVTPLSRDDLDSFDPFNDAIVFNESELKVHVVSGFLPIPIIRIGDTSYGPYLDEEVELPMSVAMFLLCKEVATIA